MSDVILLLQVRDADDPMREHEVECFRRELGLNAEQLGTFNLLSGPLPESWVFAAKMILLGGSGKYSAAGNEAWLDTALDSLRLVHSSGLPTFASCWGFQAIARAMGGTVEHRPELAEVGTLPISLTEAGQADDVFCTAPNPFWGQLGHEDFVTELPPGTTELARTERSIQAFRFDGLPVYCTQFHPELRRSDLQKRLAAYPAYVELTTGRTLAEVSSEMHESPDAANLLRRFRTAFCEVEKDD